MRIVAVVPARGGSKGIPKKNIYPLLGKPLIGYTIEALQGSKTCMTIVVSTDSEEIMAVAHQYNGVLVVRRPTCISGDEASTESALLHALGYLEAEQGQRFDYILTAQPTSPLRSSQTIDAFIRAFDDNKEKYDAQLTLTPNTADFWIQTDGGDYVRLFPNAPRRRQDRKPLFAEDGCLYITQVDSLRRTQSVLGTRCRGFAIDEIEGVDINEIGDILRAEAYLARIGADHSKATETCSAPERFDGRMGGQHHS